MFECAFSMRERSVVPARLRPTMKMGESVEEVFPLDCVAPPCSSDVKKLPRLLLRLVSLRAQTALLRLFT